MFKKLIMKNESQSDVPTLRDYFAAAALPCFAGWYDAMVKPDDDAVARRCYSIADAMLAERNKT